MALIQPGRSVLTWVSLSQAKITAISSTIKAPYSSMRSEDISVMKCSLGSCMTTMLNFDMMWLLRGIFRFRHYRAGVPPGNHVPLEALSERERDILVDSFKAIRALRSRLREELTGEIF